MIADASAFRQCLLLCSLLFASTVADAQTAFDARSVEAGEIDQVLSARGWVLLTKRSVPPTRFSAEPDGSIRVDVQASNALIYREVASAEADASAVLSWDWRVEHSDRRRESNADPDWPIAMYAAFEVDDQYIGWWRRFVNRLVFGFAGLPDSGKILTYIWSADRSRGESYPNPYIPEVGMIQVLQDGERAGPIWLSEQRDLMADFEAAFEHPARRVLFIALSADGEDTLATSRAQVRNIRLGE